MKSFYSYIAKALTVAAMAAYYPQMNASSNSTNSDYGLATVAENNSKANQKANKKYLKDLLKEIKRKEKDLQNLLSENVPARIKERRLEEFKHILSQYNAFAEDLGIPPYEPPCLNRWKLLILRMPHKMML